MKNWLSKIDEQIASEYGEAIECGGGDLALDVAIEHGKCMSRVLREAVNLLKIELELASTADDAKKARLQLDALPLLGNMSDELKELLVRERSGYYVDFYDMIDGWLGWGFWPERLFDNLEDAMKKCNELQAELDDQNKRAGEHYGVICGKSGREVYCTRQP